MDITYLVLNLNFKTNEGKNREFNYFVFNVYQLRILCSSLKQLPDTGNNFNEQ